MTRAHPTPSFPSDIDVGVAGWFFWAICLWELVFNRLFHALGLFSGVGSEGALGLLATSGEFAMNALGLTALFFAVLGVLAFFASPTMGPLFFRVIVLLTSPLALPVIAVTIFRPVHGDLIKSGYYAASALCLIVAALVAIKPIGWVRRRVLLALALVQLLAVVELSLRRFAWSSPDAAISLLARRSYLVAEILLVATPLFSFFAFLPGKLGSFIRRPHLLGLLFALVALGVGTGAVLIVGDPDVMALVAFRAMRVTTSLPIGLPVYLASLAFGALAVGILILPSRRWPPTVTSRRIGFGLTAIWAVGLQPYNPYEFAVLLAGFLYLVRGLADAPQSVGRSSTG